MPRMTDRVYGSEDGRSVYHTCGWTLSTGILSNNTCMSAVHYIQAYKSATHVAIPWKEGDSVEHCFNCPPLYVWHYTIPELQARNDERQRPPYSRFSLLQMHLFIHQVCQHRSRRKSTLQPSVSVPQSLITQPKFYVKLCILVTSALHAMLPACHPHVICRWTKPQLTYFHYSRQLTHWLSRQGHWLL